ncbi:MAG: hypothetical protein AAFU75_04120, partial [Planctomycetota bacterium]
WCKLLRMFLAAIPVDQSGESSVVRIDIDVRQDVAYAEGPAQLTPRSDRPVAPDWWRREAGSMPSSRERLDRYAPINQNN